MPRAVRIAVSLLVSACFVFTASGQDKQVTTVVARGDDGIPDVVTPPKSNSGRGLTHVRVVLPQEPAADEGATLSAEDLAYLRKRLRMHGFDIDERTGRPLFHAPVPPPGAGYYPYLPYFGGLIPYGFGQGGFGGRSGFGGQGGFGSHGGIDAYIAGREYDRHDAKRRFNQEDMTRRAHKNLSNHDRALQAGVRLLEQGEYAEAIVTLTLACKLDNGDPACRIHLAQARMAQGHYAEAGQVIRRALQLQPKLIYITLDLESHYPKASTFDAHVDALAQASQKSGNADVHLLLGFMEFQRGEFDASHAALSTASRLRPRDKTAARFLEIVKPSDR